MRVGSLDILHVPVLPLFQHNCIYGHSNKITDFADYLYGAEVQRFFLTEKSTMTHAVIKSLHLVFEPAVLAESSMGPSPLDSDWDPKLPSRVSHCLFRLTST